MVAIHFFGFSFLILILLLISTQEGDEIKIKIRSEIKRGTQKSGMRQAAMLRRACAWHGAHLVIEPGHEVVD
jgi:hypothetical protein